MLQSRQLDAFRAVMLTGGMTSAADMVRITQPAISRLIRDLEGELGFQLFERIGNRLRPTPEAVILFKEVSRHYEGIERIGRLAVDLKKSRTGSLRIACYTGPALSFMSDIIEAFIADRPDVSIFLDTISSETVLELVALLQYDIGISLIEGDYPGLTIEPLLMFSAVCILPASHPLAAKDVITPQDLEGESLICLGPNSLLGMKTDAVLAAHKVTCTRRIESSLALSICNLVSRGLGIGIVDPFAAHFHSDANLCRKPFAPAIPYNFAIALPSGKGPTRLVDEFRTAIHAGLKSLPYDRYPG